jgi:DNA-binding PadR family transcriptional regulator
VIKSLDVIQGTLDLIILKALALESGHGWGISDRIKDMSNDVFKVGQGSLYPALHRFEKRGWHATISSRPRDDTRWRRRSSPGASTRKPWSASSRRSDDHDAARMPPQAFLRRNLSRSAMIFF